MASELRWNPYAFEQADTDVIRRAATWLREDLTRGIYAGLSRDEHTYAFACLLDLLATELPHLDPDIRRLAVEGCRLLLDESTDTA